VYCPECGHNNPEGNKFCGMCGEPLPERRPRTPGTPTNKNYEQRRERVADHDPEPVAPSLRHREPVDQPVRGRDSDSVRPRGEPSSRTLAVADSTAYVASPHLESATPIEQPATTVTGPSFLGLSGTSDSTTGYSYLYEDEPPKSHAGVILLLLCLIVLGGVLYWQWQPIQSWILTRASQKVDTGTPAAQPGSSTASSDNAAAPEQGQPNTSAPAPSGDNSGNTPAAQTPGQPPAAQRNQASPNHPSTPPPNTDNQPNQAAPPDNQEQSSVASPKEPARKHTAAKSRAESTDRADQDSNATAQPAGAELVASGEKYLYGRGAPQNCAQAVVDFNAAARQENPRAMAHLGALYATGECVPLNRVQAYHWFSRALSKDRSNTYLEHNMTMLWREMDSSEKAKVTGQSRTTESKMF
jgi:outer membrane biosynthesis protein TonB